MTNATQAWKIGSRKFQLPAPGGKVRGRYHGVPFTGTLVSARFHTMYAAVCVVVSFSDEEKFELYGSLRDGCYIELDQATTWADSPDIVEAA